MWFGVAIFLFLSFKMIELVTSLIFLKIFMLCFISFVLLVGNSWFTVTRIVKHFWNPNNFHQNLSGDRIRHHHVWE